jgi:hypothetical protein
MTHTAPSANNTPKYTSNSAPAPGRSTAAPSQRPADKASDSVRMKDSFDKQLKALSEDAEGKGGAAIDNAGNPFAPIAAMGGREGNTGAAAGASVAGADTQLAAQIERMAAAIAEVHDFKGQSVYSITFAAGSAPVDAALLSRDAHGALLVKLVGGGSGMSPGERQQMARDLDERLRKRKLRLAGVSLV